MARLPVRSRGLGRLSECERLPSLLRVIFVLALLAGAVYGGMIALVTFVQVTPRPMEQTIPPAKLK
jgi:hypothetical protein